MLGFRFTAAHAAARGVLGHLLGLPLCERSQGLFDPAVTAQIDHTLCISQ